MKKRLIAMTLMLCMLLSLLPMTALAAEEVASGKCGFDLTWTLDADGVLTITGTGVFDRVGYATNPFKNWDAYKDQIKTVVVEEGLTGSFYGFEFCKNLTSVSLPNSLTEINNGAFPGCSALEQINFPDQLVRIGSYAFEDCTSLTTIQLPASLTIYGARPFAGCTSLSGIWVDDASAKFSNDARGVLFSKDKTALHEAPSSLAGDYAIPDTVTSIAWGAFDKCHKLTSVTIPEGVLYIQSSTFRGCTALRSVTIPESVVWINIGAFEGCTALSSIDIPKNVATISGTAFKDCTNLRAVTFLGDAPAIEPNAFAGVTATAYYPGDNATWTADKLQSYGGNITWKASAKIVSSGKCGDNLTWKLDADGVLTITGTGEMQGYNYYDNATGAYVMGNAAWKQVKRVVVGEGVTSIGGAAFYNCTQLEEVQLPGTLETINTYAFQNCTGLKSITIPASLKYLNAEAFRGCKNLAKIDVHPDNERFFTDDSGVLYAYEANNLNLVLAPVSLSGEYKIHPKAVNLYVAAFEDCTKLTGVTFPENEDEIRAFLFSGCTALESVTIPASVWTIEEGAFNNCTALKSITFAGSRPFMFNDKAFTGVTANAYYPKDDDSWDEYSRQNYGGKLTWTAVTPPPEPADVSRVFGATRYDTSFKAADELKNALGIHKFQNIIVACGTNFPDALAGTYLASQKNAPILLTSGSNIRALNTYIRENLASGGTVYLLGSTGVVPNGIGEGINNCTVKRLGGATRYDTNLQILQEAGVAGKDIIVCTGLNFADSLSASACGLPILLVKDGLLPAQKEFLASATGKFIIVGGTGAVNATVEKQLKTYGTVERLAGANRYDTSVMVAKKFFSDPDAVTLAYAQNFPDGLCGGPLAYALKAPLILTDNNKPAAAVNYGTSLGIKDGYVLGGTGLISDKVVKNIFSMAAADQITVK